MSTTLDTMLSSLAAHRVEQDGDVPSGPSDGALRAVAHRAFDELRETIRGVYADRATRQQAPPTNREIAAIAHAYVALLLRDLVMLTHTSIPLGGYAASFTVLLEERSAGRFTLSAVAHTPDVVTGPEWVFQAKQLSHLFEVVGLGWVASADVREACVWPELAR